MEWFRHYHGLCTDPKLHEIARKCRVSRGMVIAAWCAVLEAASACDDRGCVRLSDMQLAFLIDAKPAVASRIMDGFHALQMVVDGHVAAWSKRQRESDSSLGRVRRHRCIKNNALKNNETAAVCNVTNSLEQNRTEEKKDSRALGPDRPYFPDPESTPPETFIGDAADGARAEKSPQFPQPPLPVPGGFVEEPVPPITPPRPTARPRKSSPPPGAFDRWWAACPRKIGRKACEAKFATACRTVAPEIMIDAMQRYADRCREQGTEERYIVHPLTWINQGRWEDGVAPAATSDDATDAGRLMRVREILSAGGVTLSTVPGWASMTEAQARAHCEVAAARPTGALVAVGGQRQTINLVR